MAEAQVFDLTQRLRQKNAHAETTPSPDQQRTVRNLRVFNLKLGVYLANQDILRDQDSGVRLPFTYGRFWLPRGVLRVTGLVEQSAARNPVIKADVLDTARLTQLRGDGADFGEEDPAIFLSIFGPGEIVGGDPKILIDRIREQSNLLPPACRHALGD